MKREIKEFDDRYVWGELCRRVGLPLPPPKGTKYEVDAAEWTLAEEADFREWLLAYCRTIPKIKRRGKAWLKLAVDEYVFQYSWKYKEVEAREDDD